MLLLNYFNIRHCHAQHDLVMCAHSSEGQLYSGLHQKQCGQQLEGGDSASLLCFLETPAGVL